MRKLLNIFKLLIALCLLPGWVLAQLSAAFTANTTTGCAPQFIQFTDNSAGSPDRWEWDLGNGTTSVEKSPAVTYLNPGTYTVKLTVYKGAQSATSTRTGYIQIFPNPVILFDVDKNSGCIPIPVKFTDKSTTASGSITKWKWDFGDGNLSNLQNPSHVYKTSGNFDVSLTAENSHGCTKTLSQMQLVKVNDSIRANFALTLPSTCGLPYPVGFSDKSTGSNINSWQWDFGDGGQDNSRAPSHTYNTAGLYTVRLIVANSSGCTDTVTRVNVVSAGGLLADFTMSKDPACLNERVTLQATTSAAAPDSVVWVFADGSRAKGLSIAKRFTKVGANLITLTIYAKGCVKTVTKTINISDGPVPDFSADVRGSCAPPLTVNFTNQSSNGKVVAWQFGGSNLQTGDNTSFTFTDYGSFRVTMVVESNNGCRDTLSISDYITVEPPSIDTIAGLPLTGCAPVTGNFVPVIKSFEPVTSYYWDFGDGSSATDANPQKSYADTGTYAVKLIISTSKGCVDTFQTAVKTGAKPQAAFDAAPLVICPSDEVTFNNRSSGMINRVQWYFGDGGEASSFDAKHFYQDTGYMNVTLIVSHNGCGDTISRNKYVYVNPPIARFRDSFSCGSKFQRQFFDQSVGATSWLWNFGDGTTYNGERPPLKIYADTGVYNVSLTVSDGICTHSASARIGVLDRRPELQLTDTSFCDEMRFNLALVDGTFLEDKMVKYEWFFEGFGYEETTVPYTSGRYRNEGDYRVRVTLFDNEGCTQEAWQKVTVKLLKPRAIIKPEFTAACAGSTLSFPDSSIINPKNPIKSYTWFFGEGADTSFSKAPFTHTYNTPGYYDLTLVLLDSAGCEDRVTIPEAVAIYRPAANFSARDTIVCPQTPVLMDNKSQGAQLAYIWTFGNGQQSTEAFPEVAFADTGRYTISLTVTDTAGCVSKLIRPLYIGVYNADASFAVSDSFTTCPPLQTAFTNASKYASGFTWDFGNGNGSLLNDPSHTYTFPGTFTATLKATGVGGCVDSTSRKIVIQGPYGNLRYTPLMGCAPLQVDFKSTAINTVRYTWDFSDGNSASIPDSFGTKIYQLPGKYVPRLILEDGKGCKLPIQGMDTITVLGVKAVAGKLSKYQFCDSATVNFTDSSITTAGVIDYNWNFGDGSSSTARSPVHTYKKPGRYRVSVTVSIPNGCADADTLANDIIIAPSPMINAGADTGICLPGKIFLNSKWMNPDTTSLVYQWALGNSIISNESQPSPVVFAQPGVYQIGLTATNGYGCSSKDIFSITVNDTPRVVAQPNAVVCQGSGINLQATGAVNYKWDSSPTLSCTNCNSPVASPRAATIYGVTGTDANGCVSRDTILLRVKTPFKMSSSRGDTICVGESIDLLASGAELYSWTPANTLSSATAAQTRARPTQTTVYRVVGRDSVNCFYDSASIRVVVYPIPDFNIVESSLTLPVGSSVVLKTSSSADITAWRWSPALGLSCITCPQPEAAIRQRITYSASVTNAGGCTAKDNITIIPTCSSENIFIPNTFSPNADGRNDAFYPRGKGIAGIKSLRIFNRWGEIMYERKDFAVNDPTAGWDGTYKGKLLTPDVYVYMMQVLCDDNTIFDVNGNVTLLR